MSISECDVDAISWAHAWGPTILLVLSLGLFSRSKLLKKRNALGTLSPPVYGPAYLPSFVRGVLGAIRLGKDEDTFLTSCRRDYGPLVYLPWPMSQHLITSASAIQRVYDTPSKVLSFVPLRKRLVGSVFGSPKAVWTNEAMEKDLFPGHARALQKSKLDQPLHLFNEAIRESIADLEASIDASNGELEIDLAEWAMVTFFDAATVAMFGPSFLGETSKEDFREAFLKFDLAFPLFASGMVPTGAAKLVPPLAKGLAAREELVQVFAAWVARGMPGVEDGLVKDAAASSERAGWSTYETAQLLLGACWAIQANAPFAAVWNLLYTLQSPLLSEIHTEIDALNDSVISRLDMATLSTSLPLLSSCIHETLRLATSSFSIRFAEEDYFIPLRAQTPTGADSKAADLGSSTTGYVIPAGANIICATRVSHIDKKRWGPDASAWDGRRFLDREGEGKSRSNRAREVRAFGGGISTCGGRHLATAELKAFLVETLTAFEFEFLHPTLADETSISTGDTTPETMLDILGVPNAIKPRSAKGRVGMGMHQFESGSGVRVKVTRRVSPA